MVRALVLMAALIPSMALAQDARKFNAKELEQQFDPLPVFAKGAVVDGEVIVQSDAASGHLSADYVVAAGQKAVLDFYQVKLATKPEKSGDVETSTLKYVFAPKPFKDDKFVVSATVRPVEGNAGRTAIRLFKRPIKEDDKRQ